MVNISKVYAWQCSVSAKNERDGHRGTGMRLASKSCRPITVLLFGCCVYFLITTCIGPSKTPKALNRSAHEREEDHHYTKIWPTSVLESFNMYTILDRIEL